MIVRITEKASRKIELNKPTHIQINREPHFFEDWYVNIFLLNRKSFFIFTEGLSLFSLIESAKGINTVTDFGVLFRKSINGLFREFIPSMRFEDIPIAVDQYSKTENGRILKNQCDQIYHAKRYSEDGKDTFLINRIPLKALGFKNPAYAFIEEMQKVLQLKGIFLIPAASQN